ncbi:P-loop containing nucleoside triphosphate hydrolase protein [Aspergillus cavernicola]|uniref:P-loop containing nucleoside triphosphate hydrolase protein n=1 Tax=Aspergillus cavernicola TaxID=176166 RepID=A0ABR4IBH3_9EURO
MALKAAADLHNEKRIRVLEIIDKLRELGVSESVSLPQLVVVGDQSSGKSSLLEGLTGLSFPVASDLCTRFATQIVLRRVSADESEARITIIPGPSSILDDNAEERLRGFERVLAADQFDSDEFAKIFDEAAECMGIPGPSTTDLENIEKRFSDDILKIELSGPEHHHLSVVDVPGLFHNPTKYQTEEDKAVIRNLIERWITDKRTIILAVMDARNNFANQGVFSMARAADPAGKRTVGIITKCDAVERGDEAGVIRIAKNEVEKLTHGWFAVKNRSTREIEQGMTIEGRHRREKEFFSSEVPWTELPRDRVGIHALKKFLGGLLYDHIRSEFPSVVKDIEDLLANTEKDLDLLGPSRQTTTDQRRFLNRVANRYQHEVDNALGGNYDSELDSNSPLKLRMHVRALSDDFARVITKQGHAKVFRTTSGEEDPEFSRFTKGSFRHQKVLEEDILGWIRRIYRESRGTELPGTVNPGVLQTLFRQQSSRWENYTRSLISNVVDAVQEYNDDILENISPDEDVREKLAQRLTRVQDEAHAKATAECSRILNDERGGILQTVNHYYADTLNAIREERVRVRLQEMGLQDGAMKTLDLSQVMQRVHLSNEDQAVNDIHDILKAYYKVALKRFADNIVIQVVERHILGREGPVRALCSDMVNDLDEEELMEIAGEKFVTSTMRNELIAKCERFRMALDIAKGTGI